MSLIDKQSETTEQRAERVADGIRASIQTLYAQMLHTFGELFDTVWTRTAGLSPSEILEALGTDAAEMFRLAALLKECVNSAKAGSITRAIPEWFEIEFNEDGTVTVTDNTPPIIVPEPVDPVEEPTE